MLLNKSPPIITLGEAHFHERKCQMSLEEILFVIIGFVSFPFFFFFFFRVKVMFLEIHL
jgi:hypothetical protein